MNLNYTILADQIADILPVAHFARRVLGLFGPPGIAKTAFVHVAADRISKKLQRPVVVRELHLASMSEVDIRGYLIPNGDRAVFTKPEFWSAVESCPDGILFLDEFPQASHEVQKAVATLLLEGRIGEYVLPPGWSVAIAGNRLEDNAGANTLLSHIVNRITMVNVKAMDPDVWVGWASKQGLPFELMAFAKARPHVVFEGDVPSEADTPYCTPRSLHAVGDLALNFTGGLRAMVEDPLGMALISGAIGPGPASELSGMVRLAINLPSYEEVIKSPELIAVPEKPDMAYAMVMLLAVRAKLEDGDAVARYLARFPINFALTGFISLIRRDRGFAQSKTVMNWVIANQSHVAKLQKYITEAF